MQNSPKEEIIKTFNKGTLNRNDVAFILIQFRKILEIENKKSEFPILNFYCNWSVHSSMSDSMTIFRMISKINKIILDPALNSNVNEMVIQISEALSFKKMQEELTTFFTQQELNPAAFHDKDIWKSFITIVCSLIINQSISFPPQSKIDSRPKIKRIKSELEELALQRFPDNEEMQNKYLINSLQLITDTDGKVHWQIMSNANIKIQGKLAL